MILTTLAMTAALVQADASALLENALQISSSQGTYVTYFNPDGTYTTNIGISGTWQVQGSEICVVRSTGESGCAPLQDGVALGDTWQGTNAATGETVTYTIVPREG
ncbi:MAG: hypothetical protein VX501_01390 [Pseudomonadota bacterium]|nr:hypothetical protein [Pseudomonadota bacterium]